MHVCNTSSFSVYTTGSENRTIQQQTLHDKHDKVYGVSAMCIVPWYGQVKCLFVKHGDHLKNSVMNALKLEILVAVVMMIHLVACPYTKVEESFNIQAVHDILYHGLDIDSYDHLEFPGVVPRSFLGPIAVALTAAPTVYMTTFLEASKFLTQYIVRAILGGVVLIGLFVFADGVQQRFGADVKKWFYLVTVTQFHFMFYMTRPLPNVFALSLVLLAVGAWLKQQHGRFIWYSAASILIFRADVTMYLGLVVLMELVAVRLSFKVLLKHAIPAGVLMLGLTVCVDSFFWRRVLWPEGEVFWYNTVLNKSSNWGTEPFQWYFLSALPRALAFSIFLIPLGLYFNLKLRTLLLPAVTFVFLFSFLPHKELRFIIYVFPVLNVAVAVALSRLWLNRSKSRLRMLLALGAVSHLLGNLVTTSLFLYISHQNYPGGLAMHLLHQQVPHDTDVHVHIDVATAQTGVTRFTQLNNRWIYNKTEDLTPGGRDMMSYSHLCIGAGSHTDKQITVFKDTHDILYRVDGYSRLELPSPQNKWPRIHFSPKIYILQNKKINS